MESFIDSIGFYSVSCLKQTYGMGPARSAVQYVHFGYMKEMRERERWRLGKKGRTGGLKAEKERRNRRSITADAMRCDAMC